MPGFDLAIVGGGSAGCVLAARLSADAARSVLLVEAGPDHGPHGLPADVRSPQRPCTSHDWAYAAEPRGSRRSVPLARGKVMGGCSATNAALAVRGAPADYDRWQALGADGWSWEDVLPYFRRLERDLDFSDPWHGRAGPLPIRRYPDDELAPVQAAALTAAEALGHRTVADHNQPGAVGAGRAPTNAVDGVRVSTAMAYLWPVRDRPNLTILADTAVAHVVMTGPRATGVELVDGRRIAAGTVVVAAGTYGSPVLLLRSGIGAARQLATLGVTCRVDLPAVGQNLVDHPLVALAWPTRPEVVRGPLYQTFVSFRPDGTGAPTAQILPGSGVLSSRRPGHASFFLSAALLKPVSRGAVTLRSADPGEPPCIDPAHLLADEDATAMAAAVEEVERLAQEPALRALIGASELTGVAAARDGARAPALRANVKTYHHPVGTCAMGADPETSVVDAAGRVHGVDGLLVCDASVMPDIPSANTNLPTIMIAERISEILGASDVGSAMPSD